MDHKQQLETTIEKVKQEKAGAEEQLAQLEKDFSDIKLNPYGITSIDFGKRQELSADILKMEGVLMGLQLALETLYEPQ